MNFSTMSFILGFFLLAVALLIFYITTKLPDEKKGLRIKSLLGTFVFGFIAIAIWATLSGSVYNYDELRNATCENVIATATYLNISGNMTYTFTYANSCAGITPPPIATSVPIIYGSLVLIGMAGMFIYACYFAFVWLGKKW